MFLSFSATSPPVYFGVRAPRKQPNTNARDSSPPRIQVGVRDSSAGRSGHPNEQAPHTVLVVPPGYRQTPPHSYLEEVADPTELAQPLNQQDHRFALLVLSSSIAILAVLAIKILVVLLNQKLSEEQPPDKYPDFLRYKN